MVTFQQSIMSRTVIYSANGAFSNRDIHAYKGLSFCDLLRFSPPYVNENNAKEVNKKRDDVSLTT